MAATSIDLTSFQEALKYKYSPDKLMLMGYDRNPWFGICPKRTDFGGRNLLLPMYHTAGRGKGTTISQAIDNQTQADLKQFVLTRAKLYSVANVDRETLKASVGDAHAWLDAETALMDERAYELTRDISMDMYGAGDGVRGAIGAITLNTPAAGTDRITLSSVGDVVNFEVGMRLAAFEEPTSAAPRDITGDDYLLVSAVDRSNGYIFVTGNTEAGTAWEVTDYLIEQGDAHGGASYKKLRGLSAWAPAVAPVTSDSFFGVDRSIDVTRLAGLRHDGTSEAVHEAVINAGTKAFREGSRPKIVLINPIQAAEVAKALQGQAEYDVVRSSDGVVGYDALRIRTGAGTVRLVPDANCPAASAFMLDPDACVLWTLGDTIEMVDEDGQVLLRAAAADTFEVRFAMYGQFVVRKPKEVTHITLAV